MKIIKYFYRNGNMKDKNVWNTVKAVDQIFNSKCLLLEMKQVKINVIPSQEARKIIN